MDIKPGSLLAQVNAPADLKKLHKDQLPQLTDELRQYIIDVVSVYGGHFGASLGVVELSVALHFVFNTPYDQLVWDVGHQAYGHKILTGRRDNFASNRKYKGLSGFPKEAKANTIPLVLAIPLHLFPLPWVWLWPAITKAKKTASILP